MSKEQDISGSGRADQCQPEIPSTPSGGQSVDPRGPSASRLTIENVKKLQGPHPEAKSSLARQSVEAYLQQSNQVSKKREAGRERRKEPNLPNKPEAEAKLVGLRKEGNAENGAEPSEKIPAPDFQARSLTSSAPETRKHEFADLETQTEWSYSSTSWGSSEEARRMLGQDNLEEETEGAESEGRIMGTLRAEKRGTIEIRSIVDSSEKGGTDVVLESLLRAEDHYITDYCTLGFCEFCAAALKPFPTPEELEDKPEKMESVPCCRTYKEILKCVMEELMGTQTFEGEIDISPHPRLSHTVLDCKTRNVLMEEIHERGVENYKEVFEQYMRLGPWVRVGYKLSDHGPKQSSAAPKKRPRAKEVLKIDPEFKPEQVKICQPTSAVKKYYPDGKIFLLLLPDGTGQVYYPSGNVAILITYLENVQFTYVVLADQPSQRLRAFFTNQGYAACYFPNGNIRVHLDLCHGSSFDERGLPEKRWCWWDASRHIHAPPFQPISLQLNSYIHVKIITQDQILLTFAKLHSCIRLNVGARLKLEDPSMLSFLQWPKKPRMSVSQAKAQQIKALLDELRRGLKVVHSIPPREIPNVELTATILVRLKRWQQRKTLEPKNPSWDALS